MQKFTLLVPPTHDVALDHDGAASLKELIDGSRAQVMLFSGLLAKLTSEELTFEGWKIGDPRVDGRSAIVPCQLYVSRRQRKPDDLTLIQSIDCELFATPEGNTLIFDGYALDRR